MTRWLFEPISWTSVAITFSNDIDEGVVALEPSLFDNAEFLAVKSERSTRFHRIERSSKIKGICLSSSSRAQISQISDVLTTTLAKLLPVTPIDLTEVFLTASNSLAFEQAGSLTFSKEIVSVGHSLSVSGQRYTVTLAQPLLQGIAGPSTQVYVLPPPQDHAVPREDDIDVPEDDDFEITEDFLAPPDVKFNPVPGPEGDEIGTVSSANLGRTGCFDGEWALCGSKRLLKLRASVASIPPKSISMSPTTLYNLSSSQSDTSPLVTIHPTPFGAKSPPAPVAKAITLARIASSYSTDKAYQPVFLRGLQAYLHQTRRLVQQGDILSIPLSRGESSDYQGEEESESPPGPYETDAFVYFSVSHIDAEIPRALESIRSDDIVGLCNHGAFGYWADPSSTRVVQAGLEHSLAPPRPVTSPSPHFTPLRAFVNASLNHDLQLSALLIGARGIGKATVARRVAASLGMHLYEINAFDVLGETEVKSEGTLRARFDRAMECAPCFFLLTHIQALAKSIGGEPGREPALLVALRDCINELRHARAKTSFPVILVGTTKDEVLPMGLQACFKHTLRFEAPGEIERLEILRELTANDAVAPDVSLEFLASQTAALVAADLAALIARTRAFGIERVSKRHNLSVPDITSAGTCLLQEDINMALSATRAVYSASIGAPSIPKVAWEDVGGLASVKSEILDTLQLPLLHPHLFTGGLKKRSGVLLYGPPGTGKTLIAKAVATSLSLNFFSVKGPELLNMYIGESEANVRRVFARARDARPCVVFFDELDAVAPKRGGHGDSGGVMDRIVSQLLAELDGMSSADGSTDVFVIGATNRPDLLDPALLRPGRFDRLLYLGVPDTPLARLGVLQALTRKFNLATDCDLQNIASRCENNLTGADLYALCADAMLKAMARCAESVEEIVAQTNAEPPHQAHPYPLTAQYFLSEMATESQVEVQVSRADFDAALSELVPSVSKEELEHYAAVQRRFTKPDGS